MENMDYMNELSMIDTVKLRYLCFFNRVPLEYITSKLISKQQCLDFIKRRAGIDINISNCDICLTENVNTIKGCICTVSVCETCNEELFNRGISSCPICRRQTGPFVIIRESSINFLMKNYEFPTEIVNSDPNEMDWSFM